MRNLISKLKEAVIIGTLAAFVSGCQPYVKGRTNIPVVENPIRYNYNLASFRDIQNVRDVQEYSVPDSSYTLVHIRQSHYRKEIETDAEQKSRVNNVQGDIYFILQDLHNKTNFLLYPEGVTVEREDLSNRLLSNERKKLIPLMKRKKLDFSLEEGREFAWKNMGHLSDYRGVALFSIEDNVPFMASECCDLNSKATKEVDHGNLLDKMLLVNNTIK